MTENCRYPRGNSSTHKTSSNSLLTSVVASRPRSRLACHPESEKGKIVGYKRSAVNPRLSVVLYGASPSTKVSKELWQAVIIYPR